MGQQEKPEIREHVRIMIGQLPHEQRETEALHAAHLVASLPLWRAATSVLLYDALDDEISTAPLAKQAASEGKRVYLPRINGPSLRFLPAAHDPDDGRGYVRHPFGMLEPTAGRPWPEKREATIAIVPGRAFTRDGHRLGRGGGYYDRFLGELPETVRASVTLIGLCHTVQLVDALPIDPHDVPMDMVVSGQQIITIGL